MSAATTTEKTVKVTSDGNPFGTTITVDGEPLNNVIGIRWEISTDGMSRMVLECDWVGVEYEGPYVQTFTRPTLREVLGMWWRGRKRDADKRGRA